MRPEKISDAWMAFAGEEEEYSEGRGYESYDEFKAFLFSTEENRAKNMPIQFFEDLLLDEEVMIIWLFKKHLSVCREAANGTKIYSGYGFERLEGENNDCKRFNKEALIELYCKVGLEETIAQVNSLVRWKLLENGEKPKLSPPLKKDGGQNRFFFFAGDVRYIVERNLGEMHKISPSERWYYEIIEEKPGGIVVRLIEPQSDTV